MRGPMIVPSGYTTAIHLLWSRYSECGVCSTGLSGLWSVCKPNAKRRLLAQLQVFLIQIPYMLFSTCASLWEWLHDMFYRACQAPRTCPRFQSDASDQPERTSTSIRRLQPASTFGNDASPHHRPALLAPSPPRRRAAGIHRRRRQPVLGLASRTGKPAPAAEDIPPLPAL